MTLSPADRHVVSTLCPSTYLGIADADLDQLLDAWFADDHYADNPVYTWNDDESQPQ